METATGTSPDHLRGRMVERISADHPLPVDVLTAMRTVPRHLFLPSASAEDAYADQPVTTKDGPDGPLSCASQPTIVALMLQQLDVRPGHHVLEVGAGTGYNAALLAELAGDDGEVTTVDVYPDVVDQARGALDATGYDRVQVICGDGALGVTDNAPFDRVIVTVGPWDLPPAWIEQLQPDGRLVVPLQWRGQARSIAFVHDNTSLRSESILYCGFIPMLGQSAEQSGPIDDDGQVVVHCDIDQPIDLQALRGVLDQPGAWAGSAVTVRGEESFDRLWLRLTGLEPSTCRVSATPAALDAGLVVPAFQARGPALVEGASLAYLSRRRFDDRWELGAVGHGPGGSELAGRLRAHIQAWDQDREAQPRITAWPADTPADLLPAGLVITRPHMKLVIAL